MRRRTSRLTNIAATLVFVLTFSALICGCGQQDRHPVSGYDQTQLDDFAESLQVSYTVVNNLEKGHCGTAGRCFSVRIVLTATTKVRIDNWQLYFSQYFPLHEVVSAEFDVETINGDLKRIIPNENYRGFKAGESKKLMLYLAGTHGNEFQALPNYYLVSVGLEPRTVLSTVPRTDPETGLEVLPHVVAFTDAERQFRISEAEKIRWATTAVLFEQNDDIYHDSDVVDSAIIPTPVEVEVDSENRVLDLAAGLAIQLSGLEHKHIRAALARLKRFGINEIASGVPVFVSVSGSKAAGAEPESYELTIDSEAITIVAADSAGAFYALQSIAGLVRVGDSRVPLTIITDQPRYEFRGLHIDVARNFHSKALMLKLVEQMGAYKLNKLHFHLGDDEGWRVEIPGLPELTDIGSKRCHDLSESSCLLPQLGAGPFGQSAVNGYYSTADYKEILATAIENHIQVIPSFDMPGHSRAAVKSMEARYRRLLSMGLVDEASRFLLTDPDDKSAYVSIQNYTDNTINVCMESAYEFVDKVVSEIQKMHDDAGQPLSRYHIGADETAGAWKDSPACEQFLIANSADVESVAELGAYFIERVAELLDDKGIEPAGWGDGLGHTKVENMPAVVQSNAWGRLIDPAHISAHRQVNDGWKVVVSIPDVTYFDFPYAADPKEQGNYWASRRTDTRKVFEFMPSNLPAHAEFWKDSEGLDLELVDQEPMQPGLDFVGLQGHVWSETLRSDQYVEYTLFPRVLALAERAWHRASWAVPYDHSGATYNRVTGRFTDEQRQQRDTEWNRFANAIASKELEKLDVVEISYRIPTVGAVVVDGTLFCNIIFPGLTIEYRVDDATWQVYAEPVHVAGHSVEVRAISVDGKRNGRILSVKR